MKKLLFIYFYLLNQFYGDCNERQCLSNYKCGSIYSEFPLDDENRQWIVDAHNHYRNKIALGYTAKGSNGNAANMHIMSYSTDLEFLAQCQANKCTQPNYTKECHISKLGEIFLEIDTINRTTKRNYLLDTFEEWYDKITTLKPNIIDNYTLSVEPTSKFTQIIWARTTEVGCGRTKFDSQTRYCIFLFCLYKIEGNILGEPVYERGEPCSKCSFEKCNEQYKGLCGEIQPFNKDSQKLSNDSELRRTFSILGPRYRDFGIAGAAFVKNLDKIIVLFLLFVVLIK